MGRAAQGMGTMFLTLEDPRAQVKGSRDPLGVQPLWSGFGRHLVRNLTTVTTSVRSCQAPHSAPVRRPRIATVLPGPCA